jgi:hypothetical protein
MVMGQSPLITSHQVNWFKRGKVATPVCNQLSVKVAAFLPHELSSADKRCVGAAGVAAVIVAGPDQGPAALA